MQLAAIYFVSSNKHDKSYLAYILQGIFLYHVDYVGIYTTYTTPISCYILYVLVSTLACLTYSKEYHIYPLNTHLTNGRTALS